MFDINGSRRLEKAMKTSLIRAIIAVVAFFEPSLSLL